MTKRARDDTDLARHGLIGVSASNVLWLDDVSESFCVWEKRALPVSDDNFERLWAFGMDPNRVKPTVNPLNKNTFIKRRQATFGSDYKFAGQTSLRSGGDDETTWPAPIRAMLTIARERLANPDARLAAHVNWYDGGSVGLAPHSDKDHVFVPGSPIFSFTLARDSPPRGFQIYRLADGKPEEGKHVFMDLPLGDGDLLVMGGPMQKHYAHGVMKQTYRGNPFKRSRRINVTVRVVKEEK
jgi:alkylated DNA repair dioxygenase AlkB